MFEKIAKYTKSDLDQFESNSNPIRANFEKATDSNPIKIFVQVQLDELTQSSLNNIKSNLIRFDLK